MTVADLIERLRQLPAAAPVYIWDGDNAVFTLVDAVTEPSRQAADSSGLRRDAVVIWGF